MDFQTKKMRLRIECFHDLNPADPYDWGDSFQECQTIPEAEEWAAKALKAGRFKYLALWDWATGDWKWINDYRPGELDPAKPDLRPEKAKGRGKPVKARTKLSTKAFKPVRRLYSKQELKELKAHARAKTPIAKIAKMTKRSELALKQKARLIGIRLS